MKFYKISFLLFVFCCSLYAKKEIWNFIDQADYNVSVKIPVEKIVVMQHHSIDILAQLGAYESIVGVEKDWEKNLGAYMKEVFPNIVNLKTPGSLEEWNIEEIIKLQPDVVIAASQANKQTVEKLKKMGIAVVVISLRAEGKQEEAQNPRLKNADKAYTEGLHWAINTLGKLTNKEERAKQLWEFAMQSREIIENKLKNIEDVNRVRVFIANENSKTYGNDKYVGIQLLKAGAINVAAKDIQGYKPYTFEQLLKYNPDVIIIQDRYKDVYNEFLKNKKYRLLKAVKEKNIILAPYWTKPFGNPNTDSIALGELWLAYKFYPDIISKNIVENRVKEFYKKFYNIEFNGSIE
ncbi:iron siderophore ABC transporter, periplasmic substrate-binding protein [Campylobacter sp. RM16704]|uniref:iron siderophore ABC transporter, periplasmic substrate-binding protein n=1 Tax=Campylobacter sp. RM16704 TaxID=1500960 RepID=UPI000581C08E|nr:iron siderophore ABC transporter, periplasmic substrate-binding protein [Campylobacter sp. RM16704]AJC86339.1 iron siderophore ABC transporter, periplasmic substrate-binding protein [Campylobacter sp. RM16704]